MRTILRRKSPDRRRCSLPAAALVGASGLLLGACLGRELPTSSVAADDGANIPAATLGLATGAVDAATTSTHRLVRTLATVQLRGSIRAGFTPAGGIINSPFDLTYAGGALVTHATSWNVYVNCTSGPASCWGTGSLSPATFLRDLNRSSFIRIADQYIGEEASGRFRVRELNLKTPFTAHTASLTDIFGIIFSASTFTHASGYTSIFHVFLPQGTDMCISPTDCYSPDNPSTFRFCAFHGSVDFGPNQHVLFSVEPYQDVDGCRLLNQIPHGVIDATASTLSHEFFETITDPDLSSWFNFLTGNELGDLCSAFGNDEELGSNSYEIQEEYSNSVHACSDGA
jgi:hypothetical protein